MTRREILMLLEDVQAGDVLLCNTKSVADETYRRIAEQTGSSYTHAAIGLGDKEYAEMTSDGVASGDLIELLDWCDYIAIFRQPLWSARRKLLLRRFALAGWRIAHVLTIVAH